MLKQLFTSVLVNSTISPLWGPVNIHCWLHFGESLLIITSQPEIWPAIQKYDQPASIVTGHIAR